MTDIFTDIKRKLKTGSILTTYIYINAGIFVLIRFIMLIMSLFLKKADFSEYLGMSSSFALLLHRPWTVVTYMFIHFEFLHILFNMLWLYIFGRIFLMFFTRRQLGALYILGGIAGALFFMLSFNIFPYFNNVVTSTFLVGASASVMAIVFAVSFYQKEYRLNLLFLGQLKLIYLAIGALVIDIFAVTSENAGGHLAHIGGALFGILFAVYCRKGKNITIFFNRLTNSILNSFKYKSQFKVHKNKNCKPETAQNRSETDDEYRLRKNAEEKEIDKILDKLKKSGYERLSAEEKNKLFNASKK